jgi:KDO2-lipid IV(A) lauroyltransferase
LNNQTAHAPARLSSAFRSLLSQHLLAHTTVRADRVALDTASAAVRAIPLEHRYLVAEAIAAVVPSFAPKLFSRTSTNFSRAFEIDARTGQRLARASIRNFGRMAIDFLWVRTLSNPQVEAVTEVPDQQPLSESLRAGRGVILVLPHLGCWDVAAARASVVGLPISIVTEATWAARFASASRGRPGVVLVPRDRSPRVLLRALHRNEGVVLLSDLVRPGVQTVCVPFFGEQAPLPSGPARLSARTGAPIVAVGCVRSGICRYRVEFRPPIWPSGESPESLTNRIAADFEALIRKYPDQWYPFGHIWTSLRPTKTP